jgi:hypothetical protein
MAAGLNRIEPRHATRRAAFLTRPGVAIASKRGLLGLAAALLVGCAVWVLMPASEGNEVEELEVTSVQPEPLAAQSAAAPAEMRTADAAELDRLRISSQTWRRGGLGSRALVTFTLRNDNDYAVKDVEIFCSFTRRDGSHLTDRRRLLPETVSMKSRKTFARVHVGFINVNASQVRCSLAAARRA